MDAVRDDGHCPQLENTVGWALYALEPQDEHAIRAHLPTCPVCQETVRATEQVGALLAAAVPGDSPPPELRERVLAAIQDAPRPSVTATPPVSLDAARRQRRRPTRVLLAAAAVVLVALGGATTVLGVQLGNVHAQQRAQAAGDALVRSVVADPAAKRAVLTNAGGKPAALLVTSPSGAVVMPLGMAPNAANQTYVAWGLVDGSGPKGLAAFDVPAGSVGPVLVNWPASARGLTRFAISLEPGRSVPVTPSDVIASGSDA
ncbi:anti-sigma factor domain-containing protein [Kutzneria buriramensis]|uniref:Regulator of SigK n=1 Tax=Kutzneria buriramensis TaxID=1045776 RepID=A0A3E0GZR1_9PSEU|nr:anti-sigma factor [Kutzneria buriramensis]REH35641.1 anti-sigma-K factor rskA [Kutzneria buriramensis]